MKDCGCFDSGTGLALVTDDRKEKSMMKLLEGHLMPPHWLDGCFVRSVCSKCHTHCQATLAGWWCAAEVHQLWCANHVAVAVVHGFSIKLAQRCQMHSGLSIPKSKNENKPRKDSTGDSRKIFAKNDIESIVLFNPGLFISGPTLNFLP